MGFQGFSDQPQKIKAIIFLTPFVAFYFTENLELSIWYMAYAMIGAFVLYWVRILFGWDPDKEEVEKIDDEGMRKNWFQGFFDFGGNKKPDSFAKGDIFEKFVRDKLFPNSLADIIHQTPSSDTNNERFIESSLLPDFRVRWKSKHEEMWVEVKYRSGYYKDMIKWSYPKQFKRYKELNRDTPVLIVLGIGGTPDNPDQIAMMPLNEIKYPQLYRSVIEKYAKEWDEKMWEKEMKNMNL